MELEAKRKVQERQKEVTKKKFHYAGNGKEFFFVWRRVLLVLRPKDPNTKWHMKVAAAVQNAIQC